MRATKKKKKTPKPKPLDPIRLDPIQSQTNPIQNGSLEGREVCGGGGYNNNKSIAKAKRMA